MSVVLHPTPMDGPGPVAARIDAVQVLRALAAVLVVAGHSQTAAAALAAARHQSFVRLTILPWGAGVDLFFVISGFIMVYASQRLFGRPGAWREFLRRRITRIAPLYWICTSAYIAILLAAHWKGDPRSPPLAAVFASYLFIPFESYGPGSGAFPVFDLGWTLNYEMFFYALFALAVGLRRSWAVVAVLLGLTALVITGPAMPQAATALRFWTQPIILDFGLGAGVAALRCAGLRWATALRWTVLAVGAATFVLDPLHLFSGSQGMTVSNGLARVLVSGLPAAAVLAAATLGREPLIPNFAPLVAIGNVSYSLYLTHPFVLILAEKLATRTDVAERIGYQALWMMTAAASLALAFVAYHTVEEPSTRLALRLARARTRSSRSPISAPSAQAVP